MQAHIEKDQSYRQRMSFFEPPVEMERYVLAAATDAMAIDPESAEVRSALGFSYLQSWRWQDAWRYLNEAKSRDPRIGVTHLGLALYYTGLSDKQRAFSALAQADDQDPLNPEIAHWGTFIYGLFEEEKLGLKWAAAKEALFPNVPMVTVNAGFLYSILGNHEKALTYLERGVRQDERSAMSLIFLAQGYARAGKIDEAYLTIEEAEAIETYTCPYETATVYTALGDKNRAFDLLDTAVGYRSNCLTFTRVDPRLEPLRNDIRFPSLLKTVGLDSETMQEYPR